MWLGFFLLTYVEICWYIYQQKKSLNPFPRKIFKKICRHFFQWKIWICCIMLTTCFSERAFARFPWHFWKLDIYIFVHFRGARPFLFDDYIREIYLIKDIKNEGTPFVGNCGHTHVLIPPTYLCTTIKRVYFEGVFWYVIVNAALERNIQYNIRNKITYGIVPIINGSLRH